MLVATGFNESTGYRLLQYVCFKPADFILTEYIVKEKDVLTCHIYFERNDDKYVCSYYDASFLKEIKVPDLSIQGISLTELDRRMAETDWRFEGDLNGFDLGNTANWQRENQIEGIVTDLFRLSATGEGKPFADALKLKYWATVPLHPMMGNLNAIRSRFEVSQRFYFFDGNGISVEEAYRFLLNRWLEKKFQAGRKKALPGNDVVRDRDGEASGSDKGLLKKKRVKAENKTVIGGAVVEKSKG